MVEAPTISVVIPLYNKGPYISRALKSVLSQTYQDFEIIVVDDGSTDDGIIIVKGFNNSRISLIQQENQGVSAARNKGIRAAQAELIAFLDADDEWFPDHLETLLRLWKEYPEAGAYGTSYAFISKTGVNIEPSFKVIPREPWEGLLLNYFKTAVLGDPPISASTVAIPKSILIKMGGFVEGSWWGEDTDLWGRIALKYPIAFSWKGMGVYHTEISARACNRIESVKENPFVSSARRALECGDVPIEKKSDLLEYVASKQIQTACLNLAAGRPDLARSNLKNCTTHYLRKAKYWTLFWSFIPSPIYIALKRWRSKTRRLKFD